MPSPRGEGGSALAVTDEVVAECITIPPSVAVVTDTSLYTREAFWGVEDVAPYGHAPALYRHSRGGNLHPKWLLK